MADRTVTLRGNPLNLGGSEVKPGQAAPDFSAVDNSLQTVRLSDARGKVIILSSVPSLDTPCATRRRGSSTRKRRAWAPGSRCGPSAWTDRKSVV